MSKLSAQAVLDQKRLSAFCTYCVREYQNSGKVHVPRSLPVNEGLSFGEVVGFVQA